MITPTTELEAVNTLLRSISESPVSTLTGDVGVDVVNARATLKEIMRAVQLEGWIFNTDYGYPLSRDGGNEIPIPSNALAVDVDKRSYAGIDPVLRGQKLYDRENHTYTFDVNLKAKIIWGLAFEDMPESARHYVTYRAARKFQNDNGGANELNRYNERDEMRARAVFMDEQSEDEDLNFLRDTQDFGQLWRF